MVAWRGQPQATRLDNGPEFIAERFMTWCAARGMELRYIQSGKPDQNGFIERYDRTYRTEVLNAYVLNPWSRCGGSAPNGCKVTMKSGTMMRWRGYHPPCIGPILKPEILLCHCLLDGEVYIERSFDRHHYPEMRLKQWRRCEEHHPVNHHVF